MLESPEDMSIAASNARPWSFDLPSMATMLNHPNWPDAVTDWEMFWTRHTVWQEFVSYMRRKNRKRRPQHEEWWELTNSTADDVSEVWGPSLCAQQYQSNALGVLWQAALADSMFKLSSTPRG